MDVKTIETLVNEKIALLECVKKEMLNLKTQASAMQKKHAELGAFGREVKGAVEVLLDLKKRTEKAAQPSAPAIEPIAPPTLEVK